MFFYIILIDFYELNPMHFSELLIAIEILLKNIFEIIILHCSLKRRYDIQ